MVDAQILYARSKQLRISAPPGYLLTRAEWTGDRVVAQVRVISPTKHCPTCGHHEVRRYGRAPVGIVDAPSGGVRSKLVVERQRIECSSCRLLSREPLPGVTEGHRYTDRCAAWAASQFGLRSNVRIAAALGMSEASMRLLAAEVGVAAVTRRAPAAETAECASCLRLFRRRELEVHHDPPLAGQEVPNVMILCRDCHTHLARSWITPA